MAKTLQQRFLAGALALGYKQIPSPSSRALLVMMQRQAEAGKPAVAMYLWIGAGGSLRLTKDVKRFSDSRPCSEVFKLRVLAAGEPKADELLSELEGNDK